MGRGILAAILGCLVHGLFDVTIFGIHVGMAFWALGGIAFFLKACSEKLPKRHSGSLIFKVQVRGNERGKSAFPA